MAAQKQKPFTYSAIGGTRGSLPAGYRVDHNRICLGRGHAVYAHAKAALIRWAMFELGWAQICWPGAPVTTGTIVGVLARVGPFWSLNACRIVYHFAEGIANNTCFGFAYGTLPGHLARGEERFTVTWRQDDDSVWYEILAFSRPHHLLVRIGYPVMRLYQQRFARDSKRAMYNAVQNAVQNALP